MITYTDIAFIAYAVSDIKKSRAFYEGVLGLVSNGEYDKAEDAHWIEYSVGPATLGIGQSEMWKPSADGASAALEVVDFDAALATLQEHQVVIVNGPNDFPNCRMIVIADPDGNKITLHKKK